MSAAMQRGSSYGVMGIFFVLLGAGLVFDADWNWRGGAVMALGIFCLVMASRQDMEDER